MLSVQTEFWKLQFHRGGNAIIGEKLIDFLFSPRLAQDPSWNNGDQVGDGQYHEAVLEGPCDALGVDDLAEVVEGAGLLYCLRNARFVQQPCYSRYQFATGRV